MSERAAHLTTAHAHLIGRPPPAHGGETEEERDQTEVGADR